MTIKKIARGQILLPTSEGVVGSMQALTKQATATVEGETLTNRLYLAGTGKAYWNPNAACASDVKINGVVSGCEVTPTTTNNEVSVAAGVVNINGVAVTVTPDAVVAVRPAASKYAIYCLSVGATGATLTATKGTDGDALDWSAYGGAGQMPLCPANEAVVGYMYLYGDTAAVVPAANIFAGESANVSYQIDYIRGGVILDTALPLSYTGPAARPVCASFRSQESVLAAVGEFKDATYTINQAIAETTSQSSKWVKRTPIGQCDWSMTINKWRTDHLWLDKVLNPQNPEVVVKFKETAADTYHFKGAAIITNANLSLARGPQNEPLTLQGNGELIRAND